MAGNMVGELDSNQSPSKERKKIWIYVEDPYVMGQAFSSLEMAKKIIKPGNWDCIQERYLDEEDFYQ